MPWLAAALLAYAAATVTAAAAAAAATTAAAAAVTATTAVTATAAVTATTAVTAPAIPAIAPPATLKMAQTAQIPQVPQVSRSAQAQRSGQAAPAATLKIGVTLHPYYSWTRNIAGDLPGIEVRPIVPGEIDAGDYQPRPEDIKKLADLDAIVVNGIGHDDFIFPMIRASGNQKIVIIRPNEATPQIRSVHGSAVNSHTFISFTNAVQQTYAIARALSALRPQLADAFQRNAAAYARRLRLIKANAAAQLADARITRVVTVHDGYGYLLQEFGLEVAGVVQPAHGLTPSAAELRDMVKLLRREKIRVVFSEESFPEPLLKVLRDEAGVKVYIISHIASGAYTADKFEKEMQKNVDTMVRALVKDA